MPWRWFRLDRLALVGVLEADGHIAVQGGRTGNVCAALRHGPSTARICYARTAANESALITGHPGTSPASHWRTAFANARSIARRSAIFVRTSAR
jgi:hypothetical protein